MCTRFFLFFPHTSLRTRLVQLLLYQEWNVVLYLLPLILPKHTHTCNIYTVGWRKCNLQCAETYVWCQCVWYTKNAPNGVYAKWCPSCVTDDTTSCYRQWLVQWHTMHILSTSCPIRGFSNYKTNCKCIDTKWVDDLQMYHFYEGWVTTCCILIIYLGPVLQNKEKAASFHRTSDSRALILSKKCNKLLLSW